MKKPNLHIFFFFFISIVFFSNAQVGINTTTPNAQLEIKSSDQANPTNMDGLIIPKIDVFPSANPTVAQQGMMVYLTTTVGVNSPGFYYWDGASWKSVGGTGGGSGSSFTHYVGELYGGGIVVAVWKESGVEKGLIASLTNMLIPTAFPDLIPWTSVSYQCTLVPSSGASSPVDGQANTTAIIAQNGNAANTAATVCDQYSYGGFSDWYLPSIFELDQCYNAALIVNKVLGNTDGFQTTTKYWSSTEINPCSAYAKYFDLGYTTTNTKGFTNLVRAVRRF
jgi:hypothetical protein